MLDVERVMFKGDFVLSPCFGCVRLSAPLFDSTGEKRHSFFSRIQFVQRPSRSPSASAHLILRRLQWSARVFD